MQFTIQQIQMGTSLIVPRLLRLVADGLINSLIVLICVVDGNIALTQRLAFVHKLRLIDFREHLNVIAASTIAL